MIKYVRRRYLALRVDCAKSVDSRQVSDAVWNAVLRLFGEVGVSQAGLYLIRFDERMNQAVLRCSHEALPMVKAAVASITKVGGEPAAVHVIRVSGSVRALSRKAAAASAFK